MQGGAGSSGNYSLRRAAEDKPRTARHLPEEEAKMRKTPSVCFADTSLKEGGKGMNAALASKIY